MTSEVSISLTYVVTGKLLLVESQKNKLEIPKNRDRNIHHW